MYDTFFVHANIFGIFFEKNCFDGLYDRSKGTKKARPEDAPFIGNVEVIHQSCRNGCFRGLHRESQAFC